MLVIQYFLHIDRVLVSTAAATASQFVFGESSYDYANGDGRAGVSMDLTIEGDNDSNVEGGDNIAIDLWRKSMPFQ
jgi:hypothetical protein